MYLGLMLISEPDVAFLKGTFPTIGGWCEAEAAWITTHLLRYQQSLGRVAPMLEIGVYMGKFFSVLQNCARTAGGGLLGFDTFEWVPTHAVEHNMRSAFGSLDGIRLIPGDSTKMSTADLNGHLGGHPAAFISVDGAHTPEAVFSDLSLSESVLAPWGVIAIDDFFNPTAIGVTDGTLRYWYKTETNLVPFCFCRNKLFVAHRDFAPEYAEQAVNFARENPELPGVSSMLSNWKTHGEQWVHQDFLGTKIWII